MEDEINLDATNLGGYDPEFAIVGGIHGDETCGVDVVESLRADPPNLKEPLKLVIGNKRAIESDSEIKYIDQDLNRSFGKGGKDSGKYEQRLANHLRSELRDCHVLDLHSTVSQAKPFGVIQQLNWRTKRLAVTTGLNQFLSVPQVKHSLVDQVSGVTVECGKVGTNTAVKNGHEVTRNFLAANHVINKPFELSNPTLFDAFESVNIKSDIDVEDINVECTNFELVESGEIYAFIEGEPQIAKDDFYPALMSAAGYSDRNILGFKCEKRGRLLSAPEFERLKHRLFGWRSEPKLNSIGVTHSRS